MVAETLVCAMPYSGPLDNNQRLTLSVCRRCYIRGATYEVLWLSLSPDKSTHISPPRSPSLSLSGYCIVRDLYMHFVSFSRCCRRVKARSDSLALWDSVGLLAPNNYEARTTPRLKTYARF